MKRHSKHLPMVRLVIEVVVGGVIGVMIGVTLLSFFTPDSLELIYWRR